MAAELDAPFSAGAAVTCAGAVLLAEGDPAPRSARSAEPGPLGASSRRRTKSARVRVLIGLACRALGDDDGADMEFDAARSASSNSTRPPSSPASRLCAESAPGGRRGLTAPRGGGPDAGCDRKDQPRDRRRPVHQREDGGSPREQHLHQVGVVVSVGGHRVRVRARPRLTVHTQNYACRWRAIA